jgi:hypothetical protein
LFTLSGPEHSYVVETLRKRKDRVFGGEGVKPGKREHKGRSGDVSGSTRGSRKTRKGKNEILKVKRTTF